MMFSLHAANLAREEIRIVYCGLLVTIRIAVCVGRRFGDKTDDSIFKDVKVRLVVDDELHPLGVFALGALRARGLYGGTAAGVERLGLKGGCVGVLAHLAAQGVQFVDKMALGETAY